MRYETQTVRIGECLGPVDWAYDFTKHDWGDGRGGVNPSVTSESIPRLRRLEDAFSDKRNRVEVRLSHSDCYWTVLSVGMYDGWPFWEPTPSVQVYRVLGVEWHPWYSIHDVRVTMESPMSDPARFTTVDECKA